MANRSETLNQHLVDLLEPTRTIVHYGEVGLKGRNRGFFENRLAKNLRAALRPVGGARVRRLYGRLEVVLKEPARWREAAATLGRVFGVAYVLPSIGSPVDIPGIQETIGGLVAKVKGPNVPDPLSFAVRCKRSAKDLPYTSVDVQREVGASIQQQTGWTVDLDNPDLAIRIELVGREAFISLGRLDGPGGLPTGVSGRVVCLQSGGIDSPVAAYRLLQRGVSPVYVHFHSYPHTGIESQEKVQELIERIHPAGLPGRLYLVAFAELQRRIVAECPARLRVILYRRFMVRAAAAIAESENAQALVTGDSLGQVASQTLENMRTIEAACPLPLLRPLIGLDKVEIIAEARRIGTYDISIEPHDDCCSFLMPPNPATRSTAAELDRAEECFDVPAEVAALVSGAELHTIGEERAAGRSGPLP